MTLYYPTGRNAHISVSVPKVRLATGSDLVFLLGYLIQPFLPLSAICDVHRLAPSLMYTHQHTHTYIHTGTAKAMQIGHIFAHMYQKTFSRLHENTACEKFRGAKLWKMF